MGDPVPVRVSGPRTLVRYCPSTRIPLPSHAAAAACLPTSGPPAFRHPPSRALPVSRTRQGPLPVPHDTSRHDLIAATPDVCPAGTVSPRLGGPPGRCGTPPSARYREYGVRCLCDASTAQAAASQRGTGSALGAAITRRALRPGNVACGDRRLRGTLPSRHHAGTNNLVSTALAATARKADLAPRHYRISRVFSWDTAPGVRRSATGPAGSDGTCASDRPPDEHHHAAEHRLVGAGPSLCRTGRGSPPAGRSGRSRRPSAAPASRCRDNPPARPHVAVGRRPVGIDVREVARRRERRQRVVTDAVDEHVSGPNTAPGRCRSPQASGPLSARRGAQPRPVVGQRQHRLGGNDGDRGRDDDIAASAQPAEAGWVAAMPTNQLRTSFVPMASTRRSPNAGSIHRRTLNVYVFRVADLEPSAQPARYVRAKLRTFGAVSAARSPAAVGALLCLVTHLSGVSRRADCDAREQDYAGDLTQDRARLLPGVFLGNGEGIFGGNGTIEGRIDGLFDGSTGPGVPPKLIIFNGFLVGAGAQHCQGQIHQRDRFATTMTIPTRNGDFGATRAGSEWPARRAHSTACPNA